MFYLYYFHSVPGDWIHEKSWKETQHRGFHSCTIEAVRTCVKGGGGSLLVWHFLTPEREAHLLRWSYLPLTEVWICLWITDRQIRYRLEWEKRKRKQNKAKEHAFIKSTPGDFQTDFLWVFYRECHHFPIKRVMTTWRKYNAESHFRVCARDRSGLRWH